MIRKLDVTRWGPRKKTDDDNDDDSKKNYLSDQWEDGTLGDYEC